jgi:ankyrin repeat protein
MTAADFVIDTPSADADELSAELFDAIELNDLDTVQRIIKEQEKYITKINPSPATTPVSPLSDEETFTEENTVQVDILNKTSSENNRTALHLAAEKGLTSIVRALLSCPVTSTLFMDKDGFIPLHLAVRSGHIDTIDALLKHSDGKLQLQCPCTVSPFQGYTALHFACSYSSPDKPMNNVTRLLLDKFKADVNCKTMEGDTPLHVAAQTNSLRCARVLLAHGAQCGAKNRLGQTPLMMACTLANEDMVALLLNGCKKEDLDVKTATGDTALHYCFQSQLQRVLKDGIEPTAQHEACAYLIARAGADITAKSTDGYIGFDFCSDSFRVILEMVNKYPNAFPANLNSLVENFKLSDDADLTKEEQLQFEQALTDYTQARQEALAKEQTKGSCPMISGNSALKKRRGNAEQKQDDGMPDFVKQFAGKGGKCPLGFAASLPQKQDGDAGIPDFVKQFAGKGGKCPLGFAASIPQKEKPVEVPKGKCPIPFHNQLMILFSPWFWIAIGVGMLMLRFGLNIL